MRNGGRDGEEVNQCIHKLNKSQSLALIRWGRKKEKEKKGLCTLTDGAMSTGWGNRWQCLQGFRCGYRCTHT